MRWIRGSVKSFKQHIGVVPNATGKAATIRRPRTTQTRNLSAGKTLSRRFLELNKAQPAC
ncbi:hypothetical protein [Desulfosporosinus fructosivorans]